MIHRSPSQICKKVRTCVLSLDARSWSPFWFDYCESLNVVPNSELGLIYIYNIYIISVCMLACCHILKGYAIPGRRPFQLSSKLWIHLWSKLWIQLSWGSNHVILGFRFSSQQFGHSRSGDELKTWLTFRLPRNSYCSAVWPCGPCVLINRTLCACFCAL